MKNKITVGLLGKLHGLKSKLNRDLPALGFSPFELDPRDLAHPPGTVAIIFTIADQRPNEDERSIKDLSELSFLIESLKDDKVHLIYVSIAGSNHPEADVTDFGHLDSQAEALIRSSTLPYTIVRAMSANDRPGRHHKLFWKQHCQGQQKGQEHPIPWEDLSQVLTHCVNRSQVLSKTFTVHAVAGDPIDNWNQWFLGLIPDSRESKDGSKDRKVA
jgi:hypothetical protein